MPNLTNSEAIAVNEDLNRYQAKEVAADKRDAWVDMRVKDLLMDECCPFRPECMQEALGEMDDEQYEKFDELVEIFDKTEELRQFKESVSKKYWTDIATFKAQKQYDEGMW